MLKGKDEGVRSPPPLVLIWVSTASSLLTQLPESVKAVASGKAPILASLIMNKGSTQHTPLILQLRSPEYAANKLKEKTSSDSLKCTYNLNFIKM